MKTLKQRPVYLCEKSESDFDKLLELKYNGNIRLFCSGVRSLDDSELIAFIRYCTEHAITI